jgi:hypothetical protein
VKEDTLTMPRNSPDFERLMYLALVLWVGAYLIILVRGAGSLTVKARSELIAAIGYAFIALFIGLAARRRKNWALWFLRAVCVVHLLPGSWALRI